MKIEDIDILLVEDNLGDARLLQEILKEGQLPGEFTVAASLAEALARFRLQTFDIILLDLNLPDSHGLATLQQIIAAVGPLAPVIVITGLNDAGLGLSTIEAGAEDYLIKGVIDAVQLSRSIRYAIKRKEMELSLRTERDRAQGYLDTVNSIIVALDNEGRITTINRRGCQLLGYAEEELIGRSWFSTCLPGPINMEEIYPYFQKILAGDNELEYYENPVITRDGRMRQIAWHNALLRDEQGRGIGILSSGDDITERKQVEENLRESEELFRNLFLHHAAIKLIIDPVTGALVDANLAAEAYYGWSREQLKTMKIEQINTLSPLEVRQAMETVKGLKKIFFEFRHRRADGSIRDVEVFSSTIVAKGKELLHSIVHDITERKQIENALKASENRYHELFQSNPHPMWIYDLETLRFLEVNDAAITHYNYSRAEFMTMTVEDIMPADDMPRLLDNIAHIDQENDRTGVWRHLKKDGSAIDVEIRSHLLQYNDRQAEMILVTDITEQLRTEAASKRLLTAIEQASETILITDAQGIILYANPVLESSSGYKREEVYGRKPSIFKSGMQDKAMYENMWDTLTSGSVWRGRLVNQRKDGGLYTEAATISPVRDLSGTIVNFVAVKRDISKQLLLQAQLQQAQKMESVGRLAGGVAHDFNNMLSVILGYAQMALDKTEPGDSRHGDLQEILEAAVRSTNITRQLLAFARKQTIAPRVLDLNETIESMLKMLRRLIGEDINLSWQPSSIWSIMIDPSQIDQLLANICVNSRDAISGVGKISIETGTAALDAVYCSEHPGFIPGEYVQLSVSDNGCGMDNQTLAQVFEPFFTTKEVGRGTGLGLATVYGIVKQNNGFVNVYSEPGAGTTVRIYLPRHSAENSQVDKESEKAIDRGQGETVLIVEDEITILKLTSRILENVGYAVLIANSPMEAIRLVEQRREGIDLLLTDMIMPDMNGRDLAEKLFSLLPNLKCLFMSGYTANVIAGQGILKKGEHFIQKPFSARDLAAKVREALTA